MTRLHSLHAAGALGASLLLLACGGTSSQAEEPAAPASNDEAPAHVHPHHGHQAGHHHSFADVERFAAIFDDPARDAWQRPADVAAMLELSPGLTVADIGAGTGYFLPHLSPAVGDEGAVLALDVEPNMVEHMRARAAEAGLTNVTARVVDPADPGLAPGSVDRVLIVDTWHHIEDRPAYAARLAEALRPGGFVLVVDFTMDAPEGPPPAMRLRPEQVAEELGAALEVEQLTEELPRQYVIRARRR